VRVEAQRRERLQRGEVQPRATGEGLLLEVDAGLEADVEEVGGPVRREVQVLRRGGRHAQEKDEEGAGHEARHPTRIGTVRALGALLLAAALARAGDVAFRDVNVVPMDHETVLEHRTVLVRDGRIAAVGEHVEIPAGATVIDGAGRWLMPGLADMHVHNWYAEEHVLFLANGVTTIRNLWGWAKEVAAGRRLAPTLVTTGPILDGTAPAWQGSVVVTTPERARELVREEKAAGYPAIKVYGGLTEEVYEALVEEAHEQGLRVTGHVPRAVGIDRVLDLGQDCVEHLEGYFGWPWRADEAALRERVAKTARAGVWNCPTLVVYEKFVGPDEAAALRHRPEMRFVPPRLRATWDPSRDFRLAGWKPEQFAALKKWNVWRRYLVRLLRDAHAPLLLGTDTGNPFVVAGWAVHEELKLLVLAGLTPFEALQAATAAPARYLGEEDTFGTVAVGRRADLLLLSANPLADVANARRIEGVMVRGRWLPAAELERRLEELAASYARPKDRFADLPALPEGPGGTYAITWNGVPAGAERFTLLREADGSGRLVAQQVNDAPWSSVRTLDATFDREGRLKGAWTDRDPVTSTEGTLDLAAEDGRLAVHAALASWALVLPRFPAAVGAEAEFRLEEHGAGKTSAARLRVRRAPDEEGLTVYAVTFVREDGTSESEFRFDARGIPVERRDRLQLGDVVWRLER